MPSRGTHIAIGIAVTGLAYLGYKVLKQEPMTWQGALGTVSLGGLIAVLPDITEPATDPNHRGFFHSVTLLTILGWANYNVCQSPNLDPSVKKTLVLGSLAYASHLIVDSTTPKGLPFLY